MNPWWFEASANLILALLSGLLGAVVGALLSGKVALKGIQLQVKAALELSTRNQALDKLAALTALKAELEQNESLTKEIFSQYFPIALSTNIWEANVGRLHGLEPRYLKILTDAYLLVSKIKACDASIRQVTSATSGLPEHLAIEANWKKLREELRVALNVVNGEIQRLEPVLGRL